MVPPPSRGGTDLDLWEEFLEAVTSEYKHDDVIRYQSNDTIEFLVGEHPSLPQEGWKFLRFSSKATNGAEPYIRAVSRMARERFGDRVRFWHELAESDGHYTWAEVSASLATYDENCGYKNVSKKRAVEDTDAALEGRGTPKEDGKEAQRDSSSTVKST